MVAVAVNERAQRANYAFSSAPFLLFVTNIRNKEMAGLQARILPSSRHLSHVPRLHCGVRSATVTRRALHQQAHRQSQKPLWGKWKAAMKFRQSKRTRNSYTQSNMLQNAYDMLGILQKPSGILSLWAWVSVSLGTFSIVTYASESWKNLRKEAGLDLNIPQPDLGR